MVRSKEQPTTLLVEKELVVGVTGSVDKAGTLPHRKPLLGAKWQDLFWQRQTVPYRRSGRLGHRATHPGPDQVLDKLPGIRRTPESAGERNLLLHHIDRGPGAFLQPARTPEVIWMKVRDDYPRDIPTQVAPCSGGPGLPRLIGRRV